MKKLILLFTFTLLFSCTSEPETVTVDRLYQIEIPGDMISTVLNEEASLQYANVFSEKYLMVIHENKSEWIDLVGQENYFMQYVNLLTEDLETSYGESGYISNIYLDNSEPAKLFEISGVFDGIDIDWNVIYFEGENNLYQIFYWTLAGRDSNMNELRSAAETFREL